MIDPLPRLRAFWDEILVRKPVTAAAEDERMENGAGRITDEGFAPETFALSELTGPLADRDWEALLSG